MRIEFIQKTIDKLRGKKNNCCIDESYLNLDYKKLLYNKILITKGFFYSGSSAVLGLLEEFDNTFVFGNHDNVFSKNTKTAHGFVGELTFFIHSDFFEFVDAFKNASLTELQKDIAIKKFIKNIYRAYDLKTLADYGYAPQFYNLFFLEISEKFLKTVIDFTNEDLEYLKANRIPYLPHNVVIDSSLNLSFVYGKNTRKHLIYNFKKIDASQFDSLVSEYVLQILNTMKTKEVLVYDQLVLMGEIDKFNSCLNEKIIAKQVCVWRDPRDQFMALFLNDHRGWVPREANAFVEWFKDKHLPYINEKHPYSLIIRFEDLVLKYDETIKKIFNFCGLDSKNHIAPKSVFDPAISVVNIGAWKEFHDQEFMKQIEEKLGEYCYYPEKENLSDEAKKLLENRGKE